MSPGDCWQPVRVYIIILFFVFEILVDSFQSTVSLRHYIANCYLLSFEQKYFELRSKHLVLHEEVESLRAELEKEKKKNEKLEKEKAITGGKLFIPGTTMPGHNNQGEHTIFSSRWWLVSVTPRDLLYGSLRVIYGCIFVQSLVG